MRKIFIGCLVVIGLVALVMGTASIWLQTESGIAFATAKVEGVLREQLGFEVEIERLRLTLPLKANIRKLTLKEEGKPIVTASSVRLDISATPLLFKKLEVEKFQAASIKLDLPKGKRGQEVWSWPDLDWSFRVRKFAIERLEIEEAAFSLSGKGTLNNTLTANLAMEFFDPELGFYKLAIIGDKSRDKIELHLVKEEKRTPLAAGGILIDSFDIRASGNIATFGAALGGKGGDFEPIVGTFILVAKASPQSDPIAARLIGNQAEVKGAFTIDGEQVLRLDPLRSQGEGVFLEGQLITNLTGTIQEGTLKVEFPNLALIDGLFDLNYEGALEGNLTLTGTLASPIATFNLSGEDLMIQERPVEELAGQILWQKGAGSLEIGATVAGVPLLLATSLKHEEAVWEFDEVSLTGGDARVTGSLKFDKEGLFAFDLEGKVDELFTWAPILKLDLEGELHFEADYANDTLIGSGRALSLNFQHLALEEVRIETALTSPFLNPEGEVTANAARAAYKRIATTDVAFNTTLQEGNWPFAFSWEGEGEISGSASGEWRGSKELFYSRWATFGGEILGEEVRLMEPITVQKGKGEEVNFTPLSLTAGEGSLFLSYDPDKITFKMVDFPLQAVELLLPGAGLIGSANGDIQLTHLKKGAEGFITLSVQDVELKESPVTDLGSIYGSFNATVKGGAMDATLTADSTRGSPLKLTIYLPFVLTSKPLTLKIPDEKAVSGDGRFIGELGPLIQFFLPYNMRLLGEVDAQMTLSGTAGNPDLKGNLTLKEGLFEDAYSGAQMTDIEAHFTAEGPHIILESLNAKSGKGSVTAVGTLDIDAKDGYPLRLEGKLSNAQVVALTIAQVAVSGNLVLSGPLGNPTFSGELVTDSALFTIPKRFSTTGYPNLEVTYINLPPSKRAIIQRTQPVTLGLDLSLSIPDNLKVHGRGVSATLGGEIDIEGTIARPRLDGELALKQGEFVFGSKVFKLTAGTIAFDGPPEDHTRIDVTGSIQVSDVEVGVTLSGNLPNMKLDLFSNPPMEDREILSYLLFDSPASLIGAGQAIQLAAASTEVAGGNFGPGLLNTLPKTVGLDGLTIFSPAGTSEELGLRATKKISPNFDIDVYKNITSASNHLIIEFNFFREFSLRAERIEETDDEPGADRLSLRWKRDY